MTTFIINPSFLKQSKNIFFINSGTEFTYQSSIEIVNSVGFYFFSYNKISNSGFEDYESHFSFKFPFQFLDIYVRNNNGKSEIGKKYEITLYDELEDV